MRPEQLMAALLIWLVKEAGGELKLPKAALNESGQLDENHVLHLDGDTEEENFILRVCTTEEADEITARAEARAKLALPEQPTIETPELALPPGVSRD